jgi:hypothetical protein
MDHVKLAHRHIPRLIARSKPLPPSDTPNRCNPTAKTRGGVLLWQDGVLRWCGSHRHQCQWDTSWTFCGGHGTGFGQYREGGTGVIMQGALAVGCGRVRGVMWSGRVLSSLGVCGTVHCGVEFGGLAFGMVGVKVRVGVERMVH